MSHRERLVEELRADPELSIEYLNEAAQDDDPRIYLAALRTVAEAGASSIAGRAEPLSSGGGSGGEPGRDYSATWPFACS